ncbi:MAG: translocation/assembly module TamB domain-containing protein [Proteobacteria bacterium]|nr:translocation/assembly module TamB domain-containing protein [Pseudomonadota bacterium]MBU1641650.1 translocation/assembly module TamB domain-containing protein [Pseudomonadota bacterium]
MKFFRPRHIFFFSMACAVVIAVVLLRTFLAGPYLSRAIIAYLDTEYGLQTTVGSYGGDLFSNFAFNEVVISQGQSDNPELYLAFDTVRARYFLPALIRGLDPFLETLVLSGTGGEIRVDARSKGTSAEEPFQLADYLPASLPPLKIKDVSVTVLADSFSCTSAKTSVKIDKVQGGSQPLLVTITDFEAKIAENDLPLSSLKISLAYSPQTLAVDKIMVNGKAVQGRTQVDFNTVDNVVQVSGRFEQGPAHLDFTGHGNEKDLALQVNLDKWPLPERLIKAAAPSLPPLAGFLSGRIKTKMALDSPLQTLDSEVTLTLEHGRLGAVTFAGTLASKLAHEVLAVTTLHLESGSNRFSLTGASLPLSTLDQGLWPALHKTAIEQLALESSDLPALQRLGQPDSAKPLPGQSLPQHQLTIAGALHNGRLIMSQARLEMASSTIATTKAELTLPTSSAALASAPFSADLRVNISDLEKMGALFQLPALAGNLTGSIKAHGTLAEPQAAFSLAADNFSYGNYPAGKVVTVGQVDRQTLFIKSLDFTSGPDQLSVSGSIGLPDLQILAFSGEASIAEIAAYRTFLNLPDNISGQIHLEAHQPAAGKLAIKATADKGFLGTTAYDQLTLVVHELAKDNYRIQASATTDIIRTRLAGSLTIGPDTTTLALSHLALTKHERLLDLAQPATITIAHHDQGRLHIDNLILRGKTETIVIQGAISGGAAHDLVLTATGLESHGWLTTELNPAYFLSGGNVQITITGTTTAPRIIATGTVATLQGPQLPMPFSGSFAFEIADGGIDIKKFAWHNKNNQHITAKGRLPYDLFHQKILATPLDVEAEFSLPQTTLPAEVIPQDNPVRGNLSALLKLSGTIANPQGVFTAEIQEMALPFLPEPLTSQLFSVRLDMRLAQDQLAIKTFRLAGNNFDLTGSGTWTGFAALGEVFSTADMHALPGDLDMRFTLKSTDISWLAAQHKEIRRLKGSVEATLVAKGPVANPAITGTVTVYDGELRLRSMVPALESLAAELNLDGHTVQVKNLTGQMGGAPFAMTGSLLRDDQGGFQVDARLDGQNILFYRDEDMKVRGDTLLTMKGPLAKMRLAGDIWLTDARYSRNVDFLGLFRESARPKKVMDSIFSLAEPPWRDMQFEVRLHSRQPFLLQNNLAKGSFRPELLLVGTGELPVLKGEVYMDTTKISVPAGKVIITGGVIRFSEQEPDLPAFNLSAQSRLAGYDISMQLQGTADEPIITLSSIPPLSEEALLLLVLTGTPPKNGSSKNQTITAGMNMAVYLGKGLLANWFSGDSSATDESILDRFELDIGRQITKTGENTVEAEFRLADGVLYPNDHLVLTSEKDVYGNINAGIKTIFRFQ